MINLLPNDVKQNYAYARQNSKLVKWSTTFIISILVVALIVVFGLFFMNQSINDLTGQNAQAQQDLKNQKLEETQKQVEDISSSLKLVVKVLSKEILFSKLINQIGTIMPPNTSLSNLKISSTQGAIDITALATSHNAASQVQVNLQDPANKIFDKADLVNITCSSKTSGSKRYPCTVTIRAEFAANNPFQFIDSSGDKK